MPDDLHRIEARLDRVVEHLGTLIGKAEAGVNASEALGARLDRVEEELSQIRMYEREHGRTHSTLGRREAAVGGGAAALVVAIVEGAKAWLGGGS